jgi:hypothetical protein
MGLRPTRGNENPSRHRRASGGPRHSDELDSRFRGNDVTFEGVSMGVWPTRGNENPSRHPRASGGPRHQDELDSRFRGNDVTFEGVSMAFGPPGEMKILLVTAAQAGVHVTRTNWIPAFAGMT